MTIQEELIFFASQQLRLEGRFAYQEDLSTPVAKVLICPPHPFLGGDMDNNVVSRLNETLIAQGFIVFRFNYRGIGKSESDRDLQQDQQAFWEHSTCPDYEAGIHIDCQSALDWLTHTLQLDMPVHVIGYSFGCLPALALANTHPLIAKLVLISPPLTQWHLPADQWTRPVSRSLFYTSGDFACPVSDVEALYAGMPEPKSITRFKDAEHFFIGQETQLAQAVSKYLLNADA